MPSQGVSLGNGRGKSHVEVIPIYKCACRNVGYAHAHIICIINYAAARTLPPQRTCFGFGQKGKKLQVQDGFSIEE